MYNTAADFTLNFGLLFSCFFIVIGLTIGIFFIWLFVACIVDVLRKNEAEFPDRTIWLVLLAISFFTGLAWLASLVYYFKFKPNLKFWETRGNQ